MSLRVTVRCLMAVGAVLSISPLSSLAKELKLHLVDRLSIGARLRAGLVRAPERQTTIERMFEQSGCQPELQKVDGRFSNVICTLPGESSETIIIGGHSDFINAGKGIVDDWSGTSLLPSLYQTLKEEQRKHTYVFVAFTAEERGLVGSSTYVRRLSREERAKIVAFINLECLGLSFPKVWVHRSSPALVGRLSEIAQAAHIPLQEVDVERVGDDDTHPFLDKNIPVISIHSLTQEKFGILHSRRDNLEAVHLDEYYQAYRLVAFYLAYLDDKLTK